MREDVSQMRALFRFKRIGCSAVQSIPMTTTNNPNSKLPKEFPFPYKPYPIQNDFMRELYLTLESYKVGIFESPTGTVILFKTFFPSYCQQNHSSVNPT
jgi:hypothetical protein